MPGMPATMHEFKKGTLHSGSKNGPKVTSRAQAIAIGMNDKGGKGKSKDKPKDKTPASLKALDY